MDSISDVLSSVYTDSALKHAIEVLDARATEGREPGRAEVTDRTVRTVAERRCLDDAARVLAQMRPLALNLEALGRTARKHARLYADIAREAAATRDSVAGFAAEAQFLAKDAAQARAKEATLAAFMARVRLSPAETEVLTDGAATLSPEFLAAFAKARAIHAQAAPVMLAEAPRAGELLMLETSQLLDSAYLKVKRAIELELQHKSGDRPRAGDDKGLALRHYMLLLADRPLLFKAVLENQSGARKARLAREFARFVAREQAGAVVPVRFVGSVLAWVHAAAVNELEHISLLLDPGAGAADGLDGANLGSNGANRDSNGANRDSNGAIRDSNGANRDSKGANRDSNGANAGSNASLAGTGAANVTAGNAKGLSVGTDGSGGLTGQASAGANSTASHSLAPLLSSLLSSANPHHIVVELVDQVLASLEPALRHHLTALTVAQTDPATVDEIQNLLLFYRHTILARYHLPTLDALLASLSDTLSKQFARLLPADWDARVGLALGLLKTHENGVFVDTAFFTARLDLVLDSALENELAYARSAEGNVDPVASLNILDTAVAQLAGYVVAQPKLDHFRHLEQEFIAKQVAVEVATMKAASQLTEFQVGAISLREFMLQMDEFLGSGAGQDLVIRLDRLSSPTIAHQIANAAVDEFVSQYEFATKDHTNARPAEEVRSLLS